MRYLIVVSDSGSNSFSLLSQVADSTRGLAIEWGEEVRTISLSRRVPARFLPILIKENQDSLKWATNIIFFTASNPSICFKSWLNDVLSGFQQHELDGKKAMFVVTSSQNSNPDKNLQKMFKKYTKSGIYLMPTQVFEQSGFRDDENIEKQLQMWRDAFAKFDILDSAKLQNSVKLNVLQML